jgi:hypothetical protein
MRWTPIDARTPPKILEWILIGITSPVWAPLVGLLWLQSEYRKRVPPPSDRWHPWFAWRPVRVWSPSGGEASVWLENIERRRFFNTIDYRLPGGDDWRDSAD